MFHNYIRRKEKGKGKEKEKEKREMKNRYLGPILPSKQMKSLSLNKSENIIYDICYDIETGNQTINCNNTTPIYKASRNAGRRFMYVLLTFIHFIYNSMKIKK